MPIIEVQGLRKAYGDTVAVDGVSFEVEDGEIFGVIGPNGSGKTTTVECIQGLREPDGGAISVMGLDSRRDRQRLRAVVGSQLQESALPDRLKVWEALDLFASLTPAAGDWRRLLEQWGLADKRDAFFSGLSGGQRQRLFVALALVNSPRVIFLDEMTTGLDPAARRVAWELVRDIQRQGRTVVLVTHFMDEAEYLCDRIAVFRHGRVLAIDSPRGLARSVSDGVRVRFSSEGQDLSWLESVPGAREVQREGARVVVTGSGPLLAHTAAALVAHGIAPEDLDVEHPSLEDAYLRLTGGGD